MANILNEVDNTVISGGSANDSIFNVGNYVLIDGNDGRDEVVSFGHHNTINGGSRNDTITIMGLIDTVDNFIYDDASYCYLNGDSGDDDILAFSGHKITITGGAGNDCIRNRSSYSSVLGESGNDTIINYYSVYNDSTLSSGMYSTLNGGDGDDSIDNFISNVTIIGGMGDDSLYSEGDYVSMDGKDGSDTLDAYGHHNTITGGEGNDFIELCYKSFDSINHVISEDSSYSYLNGGVGNDIIHNWSGDKVTIKGGDGDDSINSTSHQASILGGNGNDTIINWYLYRDDKYQISSGESATLNGEHGDDFIENHVSNVTIIGGSGSDIVSLGSDADNNVIIYKNGDGNDTIYGCKSDSTIQINGTSYTTDISDKNGIINTSSGSIVLFNMAGQNTNIKDTNGNVKSITFTKAEQKNTLSGGGTIKSGTDGLIYNKYITAATITSDYQDNEISYNDYADSIVVINASTLKDNESIAITGNEKDNSIKGGKGDDTLNGYDGNDTLTGGRGEDIFVYTGGNDVITDYKAGEDTIEIAAGTINDYKTSGADFVFTISGGTLTIQNGKNKEITVDEDGTITKYRKKSLPLGLKYNSTETVLTINTKYNDNEIDLADYSDSVKTINATSFNNELMIKANENNNIIKTGKKATEVYGGSGKDQIIGGKGDDALYGEDDDDKLKGGSGADTLSGGDGDDTMTGNGGKDVFIYDGQGADVITDYKAGQDKIYIDEDMEIESVVVKGKNVTFNFGDDSTLTVKNGKNKNITFTNENEDETTVKYKKAGTYYTDDDDERGFVELSSDNYWFTADDNFITNGIDSIMNINETSYSAGRIDTINVLTNIMAYNQTSNNLTYGLNSKNK